jgi:EAL domain-containing protein (putative c-di-GMP-specific phosphodiesterase class I)
VILAIISIARGLGLHLVAEGVETDVQARYLQANGCTTMQGYLYHRPISLASFIDVLHNHNSQLASSGMPLNTMPLAEIQPAMIAIQA